MKFIAQHDVTFMNVIEGGRWEGDQLQRSLMYEEFEWSIHAMKSYHPTFTVH